MDRAIFSSKSYFRVEHPSEVVSGRVCRRGDKPALWIAVRK
jgi:hypothetical protein